MVEPRDGLVDLRYASIDASSSAGSAANVLRFSVEEGLASAGPTIYAFAASGRPADPTCAEWPTDGARQRRLWPIRRGVLGEGHRRQNVATTVQKRFSASCQEKGALVRKTTTKLGE